MGKIYLIEANHDGYITYKIGKTTRNSRKRLEELSTSNFAKLKVIREFETSNIHSLEKSLHRYYEYCHLRGEWFSEELNADKFIEICKMCDTSLNTIAQKKDAFLHPF